MRSVGLIMPSGDASEFLRRHGPEPTGEWRGCRFTTWQPNVEFDWVVVAQRSLQHPVVVRTDPAHIVYASMEPLEFRSISDGYLEQFSAMLLTDPRQRSRRVVRRNVVEWWSGRRDGSALTSRPGPATFEDLRDAPPPPTRRRRISVVTSTQDWMPGHRFRNRLLRAIEAHPIARHVDIHGRKRARVDDKLTAITGSSYHLALENAVIPGYWSEKLADAFIGFALPLYAGCPDVDEYFPADSVVPVDMTRPRRAIETMTRILDEDPYEERLPAILAARRAVLFDHNPLSLLASVCDRPAEQVRQVTLMPRSAFPVGRIRAARQRWIWRVYDRSKGASIGGRMLWRLPP